jgi:type II secretory pathway component PulL
MLAGANFYLHSLEKEKDLQRLKDKLRVAFQATFPDVKNVVNEVKQTEVAIANIRKQTDFFGIGIDSPVQILKHVTEAIPKGVKIYITEFNVEQEKIQVEAQTTSFDSVDQIRSALMKVESFENVTVGDANVTADRLRINFRVQISLKTTKHSNDNTGAR